MAVTEFTIHAGDHDRRHTLIDVSLGTGSSPGTLAEKDTGENVPCQVIDGKLHFVIEHLPAGQQRTYRFEPGDSVENTSAHGVTVRHRESTDMIDVFVRGRKFTTYHFGRQHMRPHFWPVYGPGRTLITRGFPMDETIADQTTDHVHHRSIWIAHGDVNSTDNWTEEPRMATPQVHQDLLHIFEGPVAGEFAHTLEWRDHRGAVEVDETRTVRFYATPGSARMFDLTVTFHASQGNVKFGDTKEGGLCSIRVATPMDADKTGRMENSVGGVGEDECWGKPAHWCDYSGHVPSKDGDQHVGIAVFDHPMNLRHPTTWHVRNYGLMTANPFGHSFYNCNHLKDGTYILQAGTLLTFHYRILLHRGDARRGKVADRWADYAYPPVVQVH